MKEENQEKKMENIFEKKENIKEGKKEKLEKGKTDVEQNMKSREKSNINNREKLEEKEEFPEFESNIDVFAPVEGKMEKEKEKTEEKKKEKHEKLEKKEEKAEHQVEQDKKDVEQNEEAGKRQELIKQKTDDKIKGKVEIVKKEKAEAYGTDLPISTKHAIAICKFIKGKFPQQAIEELEKVIKLKQFIPMKGEIPHRKKGVAGRYPVNASKVFIKLLKQLIGNSNINGISEPFISLARADVASRPYKRFGSKRFKRTNVYLEAREKIKKGEKK